MFYSILIIIIFICQPILSSSILSGNDKLNIQIFITLMIKKPLHCTQQPVKNSMFSKSKLAMLGSGRNMEKGLVQSQYLMVPTEEIDEEEQYEQRQNQSKFSNIFEKKKEQSSKMKESNHLRMGEQEAVSFNSLKGKKPSMLLSLSQSNQSLKGMRRDLTSSMFKSIKPSSPEHFLLKETDYQRKCENGDMKKAKYKIRNTNHYYCSRCAIILLQEGHAVQELKQQTNSIPTSQNQALFQLLDRLTTASQKIQQNLKQSQEDTIKDHLQTLYKDQIKLFDDIIAAVIQMKRQSTIKYQNIFSKVQIELQNQQLQYLEKLDDIIKLKNQINACSTLQPENVSRYIDNWTTQLGNIEKYNRLEVKLKRQSVEQQVNSVIKNIYQYLNISSTRQTSMNTSLRCSMMKEDDSRSLFTRMLRQSRQQTM